jgi:hypothetical protein
MCRRKQATASTAFGILCLGLACPWLLTVPPLGARLGTAGVMILGGAALWLLRATGKDRSAAPTGEWVFSVTAAALWIAVASYSAQISRLGVVPIYAMVWTGVLLPFPTSLLLFRKHPPPTGRRLYLAGLGLLLLSTLLARPARRFAGGASHPAIRETASRLQSPTDAVAWVHTNVTRRAAPFTDRAVDTWRRKQAHCGGMANLLHKILVAKGVDARVVHVEGDDIHTLVEFRQPPEMRWTLADPQENLVGREPDLSAYDLVGGKATGSIPRAWQGFSRLYVYEEGRGYVKITTENVTRFYGALDE